MLEDAETRKCLICGGQGRIAYPEKIDDTKINSFTYASRKIPELMHYEIKKCSKCELLFTSHLPDETKLIKAYAEADFDSHLESRFAAKTYFRQLSRHIGSFDSVLDVGCGDGEFLKICQQKGVERIAGIEPSGAASFVAEPLIRKQIFAGVMEELDSIEKFDVVTLFQTIEHLSDPIHFFEQSRRFLNPNGVVAVVCHDYSGFVNKILREKSPIFDIEHLQLFSKKSITELMKSVGMNALTVRHFSNTYPLSYLAKLAPLPHKIKVRLGERGILNRVPVSLPLGNILAIGRFE